MKLTRQIIKLTCTHVCRRPMGALDTEYGCVCGSLQIDQKSGPASEQRGSPSDLYRRSLPDGGALAYWAS